MTVQQWDLRAPGGRRDELRTLVRLVAGSGRGATVAERLESFYGGQAASYDRFRARLLQGREDMVARLPLAPGAVWVDFGGGTSSLLELAGRRLRHLRSAVVVDLSESLLQVGRHRATRLGWTNVEFVHGDVTTASLPVERADIVTFSYSLSMMPTWIEALERATSLLRPGGLVGVTDFYVAHKHPPDGCRRHCWLTRTAWPAWFAHDDVFLSPDRLPHLVRRFETEYLSEGQTALPYLPFVRAPYHVFIGRKR